VSIKEVLERPSENLFQKVFLATDA
jgi:hypothetical protein